MMNKAGKGLRKMERVIEKQEQKRSKERKRTRNLKQKDIKKVTENYEARNER